MLRTFHIKNYKSILDHRLELGRLNVFIGENGSGKSNLLEALAMAGAAADGRLDPESLYARGIRIAKPAITRSAFADVEPLTEITLECRFEERIGEGQEPAAVQLVITADDSNDIRASWSVKPVLLTEIDRNNVSPLAGAIRAPGVDVLVNTLFDVSDAQPVAFRVMRLYLPSVQRLGENLSEFVIYNLNVPALRGIQPQSRRTPLGIYGENLDVLIASFDPATREQLDEAAQLIDWFDALELDPRDERKFQGHKLGRSVSTLYFRDRFMREDENVFSAENANEGILHILFYLALFLSDKTPRAFGIDNIETALNPALCRELTKTLARLAAERNKQAFITTHNPAILDGLNLHDDEQRLFVVYRNDQGHTVTRRIRLKPDTGTEKYKLSELWMRGHLGGLPNLF